MFEGLRARLLVMREATRKLVAFSAIHLPSAVYEPSLLGRVIPVNCVIDEDACGL
jgi:hypothetical protein